MIRRAFIVGLSSVIFVAACTTGDAPPGVRVSPAENVTLAGSSAGYPAVRLLASAYSKAHPEITFEFLAGTSTNAGLSTVRAGGSDIAVLGRAPTASESRDDTVQFAIVARDGIAIVVNPSVGLVDLSTSQLRSLYAGGIRTWRELGVAGDTVTLLDRPEDETAKVALRLILGPDLVIGDFAVQLAKESDMVLAVKRTAGSVGFFGAALLVADPSIGHAVRIDGVAPDVAALRAGTYPIVRTVSIALSTLSVRRSAVAGFLAYLSTPEAADLLTAAGFAPLS